MNVNVHMGKNKTIWNTFWEMLEDCVWRVSGKQAGGKGGESESEFFL